MNERLAFTREQLEYFVNGFVQAMLFATNDDGDEPMDANYSGGDVERKSFELIKADCVEFMRQANDLLDSGDLEQHGMDFFFTRNGHGVSFLDRGLPVRDAADLYKIAKEFKSLHVFVYDNEIICE